MNIDLNDLIGKPFCSEPDIAYGPNCFSCYGLLCEVYRRYGIYIPQVNVSAIACKETSNQEIEDHISQHWEKINSPEVPCGVVLLTHPKYPSHIGCYIGYGKIIHTMMNRNKGVEINRLSNWKNKIVGYYRYVNNNYKNT